MLKTVGRQDEAIAAYRRATALDPALGEVWWSLANLKTVKFTEADIVAMEQALERGRPQGRRPLPYRVRAWQGVSRSRPERRGLRALRGGQCAAPEVSSLQRGTSDASSSTAASSCSRAEVVDAAGRELGARPDLRRRHAAGRIDAGRADPLVAQPGRRHGRASRNAADRCADAGHYPDVGCRHDGRRTARGRRRISAAQRASSGAPTGHSSSTSCPTTGCSCPFIQLVLPNAKIIDARRHPLGCCLSNFRQHFARGQDFTYDLTDLGRYYSDYVRLMAHIDAVHAGRVPPRDLRADGRRHRSAKFARCSTIAGWSSNRACLEFYKTERAVRTASSEQVRQPIYRTPTDEWRRYEAHLGPLKDALGPGARQLSGRARDLSATLTQQSCVALRTFR